MGSQVARFIAMGAALAGPGAGIVPYDPAKASEPVTLHYYLTKVDVGAAVSQTLENCHADGTIEVVTKWNLTADGAADYARRVDIDVSPSFLVERETGLKLYPNETLASFNAKATGQGGAVLSAVLSAAARLAPMAVGLPVASVGLQPMGGPQVDGATPPPPPPPPKCNRATLALLTERDTLRGDINRLEQAILLGTATRPQIDQLARKNQDLLRVERRLTISQQIPAVAAAFDTTCTAAPAQPDMCGGAVFVPPFDYEPWLEAADPVGTVRENNFGFVVSWEAAYTPVQSGAQPAGTGRPRDLVYRRPVPALMVAYACADGRQADCEQLKGPEGAGAFSKLEFAIPQLSPDYRLPLGGGIFGGRSVEAEFDDLGRPTRLSFGSDPGGEGIASTITAASTAMVDIDGARLAAINAEIEMEEALENLRNLRIANAPPAGGGGGDGADPTAGGQ